MDDFEFSPSYYNTIDQVYHVRWVAEKLYKISLLRDLIGQIWPDGHPSQLVLVGGTSGKGSTVRYLEAGLALAGKSGALTSPHLFDYRERFRVGEIPPAREEITAIWEETLLPIATARMQTDPAHPIDYQDIAILFALHLFERHAVKWGVIETGVGGRYDKTMALDVNATCLTNVGDDHEHLLGDRSWMRALEKGGIIRPGIPFFTTERDPQNLQIFEAFCRKNGSAFTAVGDSHRASLQALLDRSGAESGANLLSAEHQKWNAALALEAVRGLQPGLDPESVVLRLAGVRLPGRFWEVEPGIFADVAHNPNKTAALAEEVRAKFSGRGLILVAGVSGRRAPETVLGPLLPLAKTVILSGASHRGQPPDALAEAVRLLAGEIRVLVHPDPADALHAARELREEGDLVLLAGSTFLVDQALNPDPFMKHLNATYGWRNQDRPPAS